MKQIFRKTTMWTSIVFAVCICLTVNSFCQKNKNRIKRNNEEQLLRKAILKAENINKNNVLTTKFIYVSRYIDLNGDGKKEVLTWVPTSDLGGTSGYPIIVFSRTKIGYKVLWEDAAWTPLILMNTKQNGWRDIAFQIGGGGADWQYNVIRHNGKIYEFYRTQNKQPKGQLVIGKDWKFTVLGPIPKQ